MSEGEINWGGVVGKGAVVTGVAGILGIGASKVFKGGVIENAVNSVGGAIQKVPGLGKLSPAAAVGVAAVATTLAGFGINQLTKKDEDLPPPPERNGGGRGM